MRRKPYPIAQLTGGLNVSMDALFLTDIQSPNLSVIRFDKGMVKKDVGFANFGSGERIHNGDMEYNSHWNAVGTPVNCAQSNAQKHAGTYSWYVLTDAANEGVRSDLFSVTASREYTGSFWIWPTEGGMNNIDFRVREGDNSADETLSANVANNLTEGAWTEVTFTYTAASNGANAFFEITDPVGSKDIYIDDVSITCNEALDERPMKFAVLEESDGTDRYVVMTTDRICEYDSDDEVWNPVNTSNIFTGDEDDGFSTAFFNGELIITNYADKVQMWNGTVLADLGGCSAITLTLAKCVASYNSRVILGNTVEGGSVCRFRVRWSGVGTSDEWDPTSDPTAGFVDLLDTEDWVVGFATLVDRFFIFKERSVWEMVPTRDNRIFEIRLILDSVGAPSEDAISSLKDLLMFKGSDNVYKFDGSNLTSVGDNLFPWLYETGQKRVNLAKLNRAASMYQEEIGTYILCLPTIGDDPDWMLSYNIKGEAWSQRDKGVTAIGLWNQVDFTDWTSAAGYWDATEWEESWIEVLIPPDAPITLYGLPNGVIEKDDRLQTSSELMTWESKDFIFAHSIRVVAANIKCRGNGPFTLLYSIDQGRSWDAGSTLTPDEDNFETEKKYYNITCDQIRFKILTEATSFEIAWIEPWYIERKRTTNPSIN